MLEELFSPARDGRRLFRRIWTPPKLARAAVALVHGLGEHSGRYARVAEYLNGRGYAVTAFDHRGHGRSEGIRGHAESFDRIMDDIDDELEDSRRRFAGVPLFLWGHSMGGNLVLTHALTRTPRIQGLIACSPWLVPTIPIPRLKVTLGKLIYRLAPALTMPNGQPPTGLSRDPAVRAAFDADPLCHDRVSARLGVDLMRAGRWVASWSGAFPLPLLVMVGDRDTLADPKVTLAFTSGLTGDVTAGRWERCCHELHNEPEWQEVLDYGAKWMDVRRSPPESSTRPRASRGNRRSSRARRR